MFRSMFLAALLAAVPSVAIAQAGARPDSAAVHAEIDQLNRAMEAAFRLGEMQKVAATYADNAIIRSSRGIGAVGRAAITEYFGGVPNPKELKVESYGISIQGDRVYQTGKLTATFGSPERSNAFQMLFVWERGADRRFRIVLQYYHEIESR
jgi:ketosteroid isomerase-like protein